MKKYVIFGMCAAFFAYVTMSNSFRDLILGHFKGFSIKMVLLQLSAIAVVAILELITIGWEASSTRKLLAPSASVRRDIAVFVLDISTVWGFVGKILVLGIPYLFIPPAYEFIRKHIQFSVSSVLHPAAQFVIFLLLTDFMLYWMHRLFHTVEAGWELHQYHHSATEFCILSASRDNPLVSPLWVFFVGLPSILFGASMQVSYLLVWVGLIHSYIIHSEIRADWGFIGRWIFVSPKAHRLHHSLDRRHWGKNFGFKFVVWDRLFCTHFACDGAVENIGIEGGYYNVHNPFQEMILGITRFTSALARAVRIKPSLEAPELDSRVIPSKMNPDRQSGK